MLDESTAQLWWAGKELQRGKKLQDFIGKNEKTKLIIKLQKVRKLEDFGEVNYRVNIVQTEQPPAWVGGGGGVAGEEGRQLGWSSVSKVYLLTEITVDPNFVIFWTCVILYM